ncbi:MAG TPA: hypothetical protein ENK83_05510, partial [Aliiroseovarius sp.]|nr:hypothetical protein [Aliiroseovarius sp.]
MSGWSVIFTPAIGWPWLAGLAVLSLALVGVAAWRGLPGWALRGAGALILLAALAGPQLQREERRPLGDILLAIVDESASQGLSDRKAQSAAALANLQEQAQARGLGLKVVRMGDGEGGSGPRLVGALATALADLERNRLAGVFLLSDGQIHDGDEAGTLDLPAPVHLLLSGHESDWDRRLVVTSAPAYAILGEGGVIRLRIEDQGASPVPAARTRISVAAGSGATVEHDVPIGVDLELPFTLEHGGANVIRLSVPEAPGELTTKNNAAIVEINGVRDRLRVLLVTGEPHPGTRTWRNLLKSDASVDLVHFTILRPPDKQDGVPVSELSLIAFPTQELFLDKVDQFDLIIFDRYRLRGILPRLYLENVRRYVEGGGAVLVAAGPAFASAEGLARAPLGAILPGVP